MATNATKRIERGVVESRHLVRRGVGDLFLAAMLGLPLLVVGLAIWAGAGGEQELRSWFGLVCHQMPDRCLTLGGEPMGVCARCAGIYLGLGLGHAVWSWRKISETAACRWLVLGAGVLVVEWVLGRAIAWEGGGWLRLLTGLGCGVGCAWFTRQGLVQLCRTTRGDY